MSKPLSRFFFSLRMRLVLLVVAALVPALALFVVSALSHRSEHVVHTETDALRLAHEVAAREQQLFENANQLLVVVSHLPAVRQGDAKECEAILATLLEKCPAYLNIGVIELDGRVGCSALPFEPGVNLGDRSYFRRALETGGFAVGDYQVGRITHKASVNVGMPVFDDDGNATAVVFAAVDLTWLRRFAILAGPPAGTALTIVDGNGTILARTLDPARWVGHKLPRGAQLWRRTDNTEGVSEIEDVDGVRRLCAFVPLQGGRSAGEVYLFAGIPTHTAYASARGNVIRQLLTLIIIIVVAIMAAWFGGHALIARRVEHLVHTASLLGSGNLEARAKNEMGYAHDEIGELARVFDGMAESIKEREDELQRSHADVASAVEATIEGWARALERRDSDTEGHTRRVAELAVRLSRAMGVPEADIVHIRRGALLHDIGKMGIPDAVLLKPGPLTDEEWVVMRRHPTYAYEWLSHIPLLRPALDIPFCHHERWDGSGYPRGLVGVQIPLAARIFAVIDVYDGVTSDRPYRDAWSEEHALHYIQEGAGSLFDPRVVDAFLSLKAKARPEAEVVYQSRSVERSDAPSLAELVESPK